MNEMRILYNDDNRDGEDACKPDGGEETKAGAGQSGQPVLGLVDQRAQYKCCII